MGAARSLAQPAHPARDQRRWLAERLGAALGQSVIVENQPAAGGNLAAAQVARAAPDGHTLLFTHQGQAAVNPHVFANPV